MLQVKAARAGYGPMTVLDGLTFEVGRGERLAMIGRNGVGKTTALRAVMGVIPLRGGAVLFEGEDVSRMSAHQRAERGLGLVPQTRDVFPSLSVEENLLAGLKRRPRAALQEAYELFPRLAERRRNGGNQLSGGEQQMLSVARALLGRPKLLLMDEPLEGLAPLIRQELLAAFRYMSQQTGIAVVIVEQQVEEALAYASRALILDHGAVVHDAPAEALAQDTGTLERWVGLAVH
ncbi:ABC transporter ATP-binding protein [Xenophilus arseniciresistens]|uniref:ABC transporter ATP-binding protein n=1 Tax=Xenophilus arseniciresistens TaxID=1283306 RepID=A0AAE3NBC8_9BURK|nr:ABC transporter ATP-binding protein [Xenophilus arseniciresistens]MDA7418398.1 ABC transporter ATP-binding protein [Xenophilus arseniciresistens]